MLIHKRKQGGIGGQFFTAIAPINRHGRHIQQSEGKCNTVQRNHSRFTPATHLMTYQEVFQCAFKFRTRAGGSCGYVILARSTLPGILYFSITPQFEYLQLPPRHRLNSSVIGCGHFSQPLLCFSQLLLLTFNRLRQSISQDEHPHRGLGA
jgi:hypothetical protein